MTKLMITQFATPRYVDEAGDMVDLDIETDAYGWIPTTFVFSRPDEEEHEKAIRAWLTENESSIQPYTPNPRKLKSAAKRKRDTGRSDAVSVAVSSGTYSFDMDAQSRENIRETMTSYDAARLRFVSLLGWPDDGTIPWVTADNETAILVEADLKLIHEAGVARGADLHIEYQQTKAEIGE